MIHRTAKVLRVFSLPERHGEPDRHEHESRPLIFWAEAGEDVIPYLTCEQENTIFDKEIVILTHIAYALTF